MEEGCDILSIFGTGFNVLDFVVFTIFLGILPLDLSVFFVIDFIPDDHFVDIRLCELIDLDSI